VLDGLKFSPSPANRLFADPTHQILIDDECVEEVVKECLVNPRPDEDIGMCFDLPEETQRRLVERKFVARLKDRHRGVADPLALPWDQSAQQIPRTDPPRRVVP